MSEPITKPRVSAAAKIVLVLAAAAGLLGGFWLGAARREIFFPPGGLGVSARRARLPSKATRP